MGVTQKDIARALNVSVMAVQRALNDSGYVSKPLKEKILAYAAQMKYQPHRVAQALVRKTARRLAMFSVDAPDFFWNDVQVGIETAFDQIAPFGYEVRYCRVTPPGTSQYLRRVAEVCSSGVDAIGIVNNYEFQMRRIFAAIEKYGIPYITFNVDAEDSHRACFIGPDYALEGRLAAEFTARVLHGRGRVLVLHSSIHDDWKTYTKELSNERLAGFLAYLCEDFPSVHCDVKTVDHTLTEEEVTRRVARLLKTAPKRPDAIFCIPHYSVAVGRCLRDLGMSGSTALVAFDLSPALKDLIREGVVTGSICQKPVLQGYYAVRMLERILESKAAGVPERIFVSPHLVLKSNVEVSDDLFTITAHGIGT